MKSARKKIFSNIILIIAAALAVILGLALWLARSNESFFKNSLLSIFPLPVMLVENHPIYSDDFFSRLQTHKAIYNEGAYDLKKAKTQILQRLLYEKKLALLASRKKSRLVNWRDLTGLPEAEIEKNQVLKNAAESEATEDALKFWYNSQMELNPEAYKTANFVLAELKRGKDFQELAKIYSQDISSRQFGGDLGPVLAENLIFELKEKLLQSSQGDTLILPSRLGLHVIQAYGKKMQSDSKDVLYLKQIFIKGTDFNAWVSQETKNYKIINIINI